MSSLRLIYTRATSMCEWGAMLACGVNGAIVLGAYAYATYHKLASQRKLLSCVAGSVLTHSVVCRLFANGTFTPSNRRANAMMEMYMKRLDRFVATGDDGTGVAGSLLTPLAVVTGSNSGLGKVSAENLAACGWKVIMPCIEQRLADEACLDVVKAAQDRLRVRFAGVTGSDARARADGVIASIAANVSGAYIDLSKTETIDAFVELLVGVEATAGVAVPAGVFSTRHDGLRLLMNNAGVLLQKYDLWSAEGVQSMFNINYASPAYLTHLVMERIITSRVEAHRAAGGDVVPFRTVNLGSSANLWAMGVLNPRTVDQSVEMMRGILGAVGDPSQTPSNNSLLRGILGDTYGISKLGNMALAHNCTLRSQAAGTQDHVTSFAIHPGGVRTSIFHSFSLAQNILTLRPLHQFILRSIRNGANNQTYMSLALVAEQIKTDSFTRSVAAASGYSTDAAIAKATGPLNALIIPSSTSGQFLLDIGQGKGEAVAVVANTSVYSLYDEWTKTHIAERIKFNVKKC